jgi:hypothetical protein
MRKIEARLGGEHGDLPDKPKRMRWATYDRLLGEYQEADFMSMIKIMKYLAPEY